MIHKTITRLKYPCKNAIFFSFLLFTYYQHLWYSTACVSSWRSYYARNNYIFQLTTVNQNTSTKGIIMFTFDDLKSMELTGFAPFSPTNKFRGKIVYFPEKEYFTILTSSNQNWLRGQRKAPSSSQRKKQGGWTP